jgi:quinol monooxygenase YgiN
MSHLEAHFVAPHMATFQTAMADLSISGRNITVYESEVVRSL